MTNRFLSSDMGREILARSSSLEIKMYRCHKGGLCCTYEIHGSVGKDPFEDSDDDEGEDDGDLLARSRQLEARAENDRRDMAFVVDLLREFKSVER